MSGTMTSRSLRDFAPLARLALGAGAPVPFDPTELSAWAGALDEGLEAHEQFGPGILAQHCRPGQTPRQWYGERLAQSVGVVATTESSALGTGLEIRTLRPDFPILGAHHAVLQRTGQDPDGQELESPTDLARVAKLLSQGLFYRWEWPGGIRDVDWLAARGQWAKAVRAWLESSPPAGLDSPGLVAAACRTGHAPTGALECAWRVWAPQVGKAPPPVAAVWVSWESVDWAVEWAKGGGIVWADSPEWGAEVAARADLPYFPQGTDPSTSKAPAIVASRRAHGTGKNLFQWSRNLVVVPPASGQATEQLLGRTHRPGQTADTVTVDFLVHVPALRRALDTARADAAYLSATLGNSQKLEVATWIH